jgi:hypothetical protein
VEQVREQRQRDEGERRPWVTPTLRRLGLGATAFDTPGVPPDGLFTGTYS